MANFCEVVGQRLAWHQAPRWGKKAKKGVKQQKIKIIIKKKKKKKKKRGGGAVDWGGERATARFASLILALCGFFSNPLSKRCIFLIIMLNDGQPTRIPS